MKSLDIEKELKKVIPFDDLGNVVWKDEEEEELSIKELNPVYAVEEKKDESSEQH